MAFSTVVYNDTFDYCYWDPGSNLDMPLKQSTILFRVTTTHYLSVWMDGARLTEPEAFSPFDDGGIEFYIPNDGIQHSITLKDDGTHGTPEAESQSYAVSAEDCTAGVVSFAIQEKTLNPDTRETYVDVQASNNNWDPQTVRLMLDGKQAGQEMVLRPESSSTQRITVPADGKTHVVSAELNTNGQYADQQCLWYVFQAASPQGGDTGETEEATEFVPGETVILESTEGSTPLATDGSEWVLLEIAPRGTEDWVPAGGDSGLIQPDEDGSWSASIPTEEAAFPIGSEWAVRARHFRNYQASLPDMHYFVMVEGPPPGTGEVPTPAITGPHNHNQWGGTWMTLYGTGAPGARIEFSVERVTSWGSASYAPLDTTVNRNGRWRTYVYGEQRSWPFSYKVLGYRARAHMNGEVSDWSNRLDVTWYYPRR